jgi:hypothetical protein
MDESASRAAALGATTARDAALGHREHVQRALVALEGALAAPAPGRETDWAADVVARLHDLRGEFARHVEITEGADGLYDEILAVAPQHARALDALRNEHAAIESGIRTALAAVAQRTADAAWVDERREECLGVLGRLVRHRQRGADLTWQAYNTELGSG